MTACRDRVRGQVARRAGAFLRLLELGVFARPSSPYGRLFRHAGIDLTAVTGLVRARGVEGALDALFDAGVHLTHGECRGLVPVERGSLRFRLAPGDLDNPLSCDAFTVRTGGSRSPGRRNTVDFDMLAVEAPHHGLMVELFGLADRPLAVWRDVPPAAAGFKDVLRFSKVGRTPARWFSQHPFRPFAAPRHHGITTYGLVASRIVGRPLPRPELVTTPQVERVARWLADQRVGEAGAGVLDTTPSGAVRVCGAAEEAGLDITGSAFVLGGEPFTRARSAILRRGGTRGLNRYAMAEVGIIGVPCAADADAGDVHLMLDKLAVVRRPTTIGAWTVGELHLTTLHPASPKILINAATGDHADLGEWDCGCPLRDLGLRVLLRGIFSHEKLTSEGMTFAAQQLTPLVDELLPRRFGGRPTDYQFVEDEEDGLTRLTLRISPRVGAIDDAVAIETVLGALGRSGPAADLMAGAWRLSRTLRVSRREPHVTNALKVLPLFVATPPD